MFMWNSDNTCKCFLTQNMKDSNERGYKTWARWKLKDKTT